MTEPTDAELRAWVQELIASDDSVRTNDEHDHMNFARAVLAKWGTPPTVAGEPVAWLSTDCIGERYLCFTKPKDSDHVRPLVFGDVQAGAVPLTDEQIEVATGAKIGTPLFLAAKGFVLATEAAHGIKGGQHGAE